MIAWGNRYRLLKSAAARIMTGPTAAFHGDLSFCFARLGSPFLGALLFTLGAIRNILPARSVNIVFVFFFQTLVVFKSVVAICTKESTHMDENLV
jgi:hypothetical protein